MLTVYDPDDANKYAAAEVSAELGKVATIYGGIVVNATYKGAEADQPGSWGLFANYYNQDELTYVAHTTDAETFGSSFKGYGVGANYAFAKGIVGTVAYYDTKDKDNNADKNHKLWTDITFTF